VYNVSLEIDKDDRVAIIGANGVGGGVCLALFVLVGAQFDVSACVLFGGCPVELVSDVLFEECSFPVLMHSCMYALPAGLGVLQA
jgi:ABC-type transport system involved in cytochrome bd biosynthesis fused ATPase/permease subunit